MKKEKRVWEERKIYSAKRDSGAMWGTVKTWLGWGNNGPPSKLVENGKIFSSQKSWQKL